MRNFEDQPGCPNCVANLEHWAGLPPHVGNTRTSNYSAKLAKLRHMAILDVGPLAILGTTRRFCTFYCIYGADRFTAERDADSPNLTRTGRAFTHFGSPEYSHCSQKGKQVHPVSQRSTCRQLPCTPCDAAMLSRLNKLRHIVVVHRADHRSTTLHLK